MFFNRKRIAECENLNRELRRKVIELDNKIYNQHQESTALRRQMLGVFDYLHVEVSITPWQEERIVLVAKEGKKHG